MDLDSVAAWLLYDTRWVTALTYLSLSVIGYEVGHWQCRLFALSAFYKDVTHTHFLLQMCELLSYLCDCELQHRVEAIVAFGDIYVSKLQANQKFRYNELMQALNMSAALTARKTREFRSPPQEQVSPILNSIPLPVEKST